jgi:hypothetical protein
MRAAHSIELTCTWLQVDESAIIESLELACNPAKPDGAWITHYDMVEDGDRIKLVDTQQVSGLVGFGVQFSRCKAR